MRLIYLIIILLVVVLDALKSHKAFRNKKVAIYGGISYLGFLIMMYLFIFNLDNLSSLLLVALIFSYPTVKFIILKRKASRN